MTKAPQEEVEQGMQRMTRRRLIRVGAGIVGVAGVLSAGFIDAGAVSAAASRGADAGRGDVDRASLQKAYLFLNTMMDAYQSRSTPRLAQSYSDQQGLNSTAFIYDNALQIIAYLGRRTREDMARADPGRQSAVRADP